MLRGRTLSVLFPGVYYYKNENDNELEYLFYRTRVVGYMIGIEDRFNIFAWTSDEIKMIMHIDFWNNLYPEFMNKEFLRQLACNKLLCGKSIEIISPLVCKLVHFEIIYFNEKILKYKNENYSNGIIKLFIHLKYFFHRKIMKYKITRRITTSIFIILTRYLYNNKITILKII